MTGIGSRKSGANRSIHEDIALYETDVPEYPRDK